MLSVAKLIRILTVTTAAALLLAFVGAFGTGETRLLPRVCFWLVVVETGALISTGVSVVLQQWGRLVDTPPVEGGVMTLFIALPLTLVTSGAADLFDIHPTALRAGTSTFLAVLGVSAAITTVIYLAAAASRSSGPLHVVTPTAEIAEEPEARRPRLADRLPAHSRLDSIIALESEDHYVRVHLVAASHLVLIRLIDAITEMEPTEGAKTHRSWWVARAAIIASSTSDGKGELELSNGLRAPISRSKLPALRAAGWL